MEEILEEFAAAVVVVVKVATGIRLRAFLRVLKSLGQQLPFISLLCIYEWLKLTLNGCCLIMNI